MMKRLWGVRHIRWFYHTIQCERHAAFWAQFGIGLGYPTAHDEALLEAIWRGEV
jgi:hypothetical protein